MKQGELWFANLNPVKGSEQAGMRPVVIISGNLLNDHLNTVICCPLTTKIKNYKGDVVLNPTGQNGLTIESEILTHHIQSISKDRMIKRIGTIEATEIQLIKKFLNEILTY
ncbi:MAG: type II toxin-antitoxin system PemK/MazF family toxin [Flavobacteriales bacterium]